MGRKLGLDRVLDCLSLSLCTNACACVHFAEEDEDEANERKALVSNQLEELVKLRDFVDGAAKTLAFHLEPKTVELKVSMHCYGCAKKVQKHISKMDGHTWLLANTRNSGTWTEHTDGKDQMQLLTLPQNLLDVSVQEKKHISSMRSGIVVHFFSATQNTD